MKRKSFTVIEMLVCIVVATILCCIVFGSSGCGHSSGEITESMRNYAQTAYPGKTVTAVQCVETDSDGDGYVSCSATILNPDGTLFAREAAECRSVWGSGCRMVGVR